MSKTPSPQYMRIRAVLFFFVATKKRLAENDLPGLSFAVSRHEITSKSPCFQCPIE
jgi:hypothetical protein